MTQIEFTLLSDGSSDQQLIPLLLWVLRQKTELPISGSWANLGILGERPRSLRARVEKALEFYPCSILFVHRDAEGQSRDDRLIEIHAATEGVQAIEIVPVIPVRMQEAWFLFDEKALRTAAGNPNGNIGLELPRLDRLESIPDPKALLFSLLQKASGLTGRRLKRFRPHLHAYRLGELIEDYSPLRRLPAFRAMEADVDRALASMRVDT